MNKYKIAGLLFVLLFIAFSCADEEWPLSVAYFSEDEQGSTGNHTDDDDEEGPGSTGNHTDDDDEDGQGSTGNNTDNDETNVPSLCPDSLHPHWIDLGLPSGTKWRCCNEGASTPEAYGGYYTFGQVSSAPTLNQIKELLDKTTSTWTSQNGVNGRKFTGSNGGSIFLPAAGFRWGGKLRDVGSRGYYCSSTPYDELYACVLYFISGYADWDYYGDRNYGQSVRPVR